MMGAEPHPWAYVRGDGSAMIGNDQARFTPGLTPPSHLGKWRAPKQNWGSVNKESGCGVASH